MRPLGEIIKGWMIRFGLTKVPQLPEATPQPLQTTEQITQTYAELQIAARQIETSDDLRTVLEEIYEADLRVQKITVGSFQKIVETVYEVLQRRNEEIKKIDQAIAEIDKSLRESKSQEILRLDRETLRRLTATKNEVWRAQAETLLRLQILWEAFSEVNKAREERRLQTETVRQELMAIEAAEKRAHQAQELIEETNIRMIEDRQRLELTIAKISPQLLQLVEAAAKLHVDMIAQSATVLEEIHDQQTIDEQLDKMANSLLLREEIATRLAEAATVKGLRLLGTRKVIDTQAVVKTQDNILKNIEAAFLGKTFGMTERELSPSEMQIMIDFKARFFDKAYLHKEITWERVRTALLGADSKVLKKIEQMEDKGHEPNVYDFDDEGFEIGTCSAEAPPSTLLCVYDESARKLVEKDIEEGTNKVCNGSAVEMAEAMGVQLMSPDQWQVLRKKTSVDDEGFSWLSNEGRDPKEACDAHNSKVYNDGKCVINPKRGWRGTFRVPWAETEEK